MNYFRQLLLFIRDIILSRGLIWELARNDFRKKYLGSYLGITWAFIQPTLTVLIFWFVFEVGFKSKPTGNVPFVLWLVSGMIPWFFFAESLTNSTTSIIENSYLVSKVVFRVSILPLIKISSAMIIHMFFIGFLIILFFLYGYSPNIFYLQIPYYLLGSLILLMCISWILSSLVVFLRDISQFVGVIIQFGFWGTPIFWSLQIVPPQYQVFFKLNPVYYLVEGYRNTFVYHKWFWENPYLTAYFWSVTITIFAIGAIVFRKLRPHFADVL